MGEKDFLTAKFEENRAHLRAVAYRMLGSLSEADDAVQEAWLRLSHADTDAVENLKGWLTTVVTRVCLDALRKHKSRREEPLEVHVPDPVVTRDGEVDPELDALLADSVGLALLVVLETLTPAERIAFVLHDMFDVPFDDVAAIVERSPIATRKLASRARQKVQGVPEPDADLSRQREVVNAFFAAAREGDFDALVSVLDPDVVIRTDGGAERASYTGLVRGAETVARQALTFGRLPAVPAVVNGAAGAVSAPGGKPFSIMAFTVHNGKIVAIDVLADPERLQGLNLAALENQRS